MPIPYLFCFYFSPCIFLCIPHHKFPKPASQLLVREPVLIPKRQTDTTGQ